MTLLDVGLVALTLGFGALAWCRARGVYNAEQDRRYWAEVSDAMLTVKGQLVLRVRRLS